MNKEDLELMKLYLSSHPRKMEEFTESFFKVSYDDGGSCHVLVTDDFVLLSVHKEEKSKATHIEGPVGASAVLMEMQILWTS